MSWHDTHLRLMSTLPVRTHQQRDRDAPRTLGYVGRPRESSIRARHEAIVRLHGQGLSHQEIAERLGVTRTTVRNHLKATNGR